MGRFARAAGALALAGALPAAAAQGGLDLDDPERRAAYAMGVNIGRNILEQGFIADLQADAFLAGMRDALSDEVRMEQAEVMETLQAYMRRLEERETAERDANLRAGEAFLAANAAEEGVVALDSGLQYRVLASGPAGGEPPAVDGSVLAHYHGTLIDGTVFDSSMDRGEPVSFGVSQVIAGWTEALQLMRPGDRWRLFIPPDLAYGEASPTPAIPPNSTLVFDVELLEVD